MPKTRIYDLAKQLNVGNKEIIEKMNAYGKPVNNHMSSLDDADVERLRNDFQPKKPNVKPAVNTESAAQKAAPPVKPSPEGAKRDENRPSPHPRVDAEGRPLPSRPRVDAEGKPLPPRPRVDAEGKPLPPRQRVDAEGRPLPPRPRVDAEGRPLPPRPRLDAEGRPLPPRPRLDAEGRPLPPRPRVDAEGRPLPPRPRLDAEGRPLPPRPRLDAEGRPLPPRPRVDAEGRPLPPRPRVDAEGRPLPPRPRVDAEGRPLPPRPRLDAEGRPLPPRPRLDAEGRPLPPRPRPESEKPVEPTKPTAAPAPAEANVTPPSPTQAPVPAATAAPRTDQRPPRPDNRDNRDNRQPRSPGAPRPDGQRTGQPRPPQQGQRPFTPRPPGQGGGNRPPGQGGGYRQPGQGGARPHGQGGARPQGGGFNKPGSGFVKKDGSGGAGFANRPRPAGGGFGGVKKEGVKTGEPSKDDRKQAWKSKTEGAVKSKDGKDTGRKENQNFYDKSGQRRSGPRRDKSVVKKVMPKTIIPTVTEITVAPEITVRDLAEKLYKSNADIIKVLMKKGVMVTANQTIDYETAEFVAEAFNVLVYEYKEVDVFEEAFSEKPDDDEQLVTRPPVVVVMGHVDHGKTSLLDVIRDAGVRHTEAGGITQHIGAYSVEINGKPITFLDTPGHEAFTAMRMRGAQVTDIAILVVAANDGVMPQTVEAINHAKAAGVDIIVAINKIDLPSANPDRVKQELTEYDLVVEDWGGETIAVPVSALQKTGIEQLLEMIIIVAEMKELRANPDKPARGSIIEAKLDKGRGPVATVLVQDGTLRVGDPIVAGSCFGKIRAMTDDKGRSLNEAGPSVPVEIIGLSEVPASGDMFYVAVHEKQARQLSESVVAKGRESMIKASSVKVSLDDLFNQIQAGNVKDLNVVVKADVQGSVEALKTSLDKLSNDQVRVRTIHGGVGAITESDVMLASASNAIIIGFNVRPDTNAKAVAEAEKVDVRMYRVIYAAIDDISAAMKGMLDPEFEEKVLGHAEIRQIFKASSVGSIGGSYVLDGKITRNAQVRIVRDGRVVYEGTLDTLRRFKDDVREVASGYECGLLFHRFNDIKEGDRVEAFVMEEIPR